jgi:hypothetical protein
LEQAAKPDGGIQCRQFPDECICYPDLKYGLDLKAAEMRAAKELPCPLHGNRIPNPSTVVYRAAWALDKETLDDLETTNPEQKKQYTKAVQATRAYLKARR